jgi:plasmid stability protein
MRHLTVRNVPGDLAGALEREKRRRGTSLNQTVLDLLRQALGAGTGSPKSNGLAALAGDWTAAECRTFEASIAVMERIDRGLWR